MDAATLGACRVTAPVPIGTARGVRVSTGSVLARAPVRAVANAGRVCAGWTRATARSDALGARDAAASRSASWTRAARVTRGSQNIRRATAPNGACLFRDRACRATQRAPDPPEPSRASRARYPRLGDARERLTRTRDAPEPVGSAPVDAHERDHG